MSQVTYPGVYVEEVSSGVRTIQAASTSIAAFIGMTEKGAIGEAVKIYNFKEYQALYGGFLDSSYLTHAVYQFFTNGGTKCYIVRVSGENTETAAIVLNDRGNVAQQSLTISAISPGVWGNKLAIIIADGTNDPGNEFNLSVFLQDSLTPLETYTNLSMVPGTSNYVETRTAASRFIRVVANQANTNVQQGTSRGATAPLSLDGTGRTKLRINIDGDGYQEADLSNAVGGGVGQVADLASAAHIAAAITYVVAGMKKFKDSTDQKAFDNFTCHLDSGVLLLSSGMKGAGSSVNVSPASNLSRDVSGLLHLGKLEGGTETVGASVTRPCVNPAGIPPANFYLVGDNAAPTAEVVSVHAGWDGDPITTDTPYIDAFQALDDREDVSLITVPGIGTSAVVGAGMNYCANRPLSDCFFIGDMSLDDDTVPEAQSFRNAITPKNSYGAVYLPWVKMLDPTGVSPEPILVPPSGYVAGLYAKTDAQHGVWKAPAGTAAALGNAVGISVSFTDPQQGDLNPINVNVIRQFSASGIVLWGARTITSDPEWAYIPVRRTSIFLRVSIYRSIQWVVFEPNDEPLWAQIRLNIGAFMHGLFRQGAFQGKTPKEAYFVKCDGETTTQDDINRGIVNILVGFAPLKPAEFVIIRLQQMAGQIQT